MSTRCSQTTAHGEPCRAWAIRGSDPPRCSSHSRRAEEAGAPGFQEPFPFAKDGKKPKSGRRKLQNRRHFYSRSYSLDEIADLVNLALDRSLDDELAAARIAVRRVMEQLQEELTPKEYANMASLVFTGANTISRLMRTQRVLEGKAADNFAVAISMALDELSIEWGVDL